MSEVKKVKPWRYSLSGNVVLLLLSVIALGSAYHLHKGQMRKLIAVEMEKHDIVKFNTAAFSSITHLRAAHIESRVDSRKFHLDQAISLANAAHFLMPMGKVSERKERFRYVLWARNNSEILLALFTEQAVDITLQDFLYPQYEDLPKDTIGNLWDRDRATLLKAVAAIVDLAVEETVIALR